MKLLEAMRIINAPADPSLPIRQYVLACGFTPLALETFLRAHLVTRGTTTRVAVETGLYGDLAGTLERAAGQSADGVAAVLEWADLDPRLGMRGHGTAGFGAGGEDLVRTVRASLTRLERAITALGASTTVAVVAPTLPPAPVFVDLPMVSGRTRLLLDEAVAGFLASVGGVPNVRVVRDSWLAEVSPAATRHDVGAELAHGFPYSREHADRVAEGLAVALRPSPAKKGLVTDLDDTLWRGLVGEVGAGGVAWGLEAGAQVHSLYQRMLANLAEAGVLLAVASKNDLAVVREALRRDDLLVPADAMFPLQVSWDPKSGAIAEILRTWNIAADAVVFVDDSPLELAEVQHAFPEIECLRFEPHDPASVLRLLERLAALFGRAVFRDEDRLRMASIRNAESLREAATAGEGSHEQFLETLGSEIDFTMGRDATDGRALELLNKTNQFNLNGRRYETAEWHALLARPEGFLLTGSYRDKFGPIGKITVAHGVVRGDTLHLENWVLSCRAFARRVEHACLQTLLDLFGCDFVVLDFHDTGRNGPARQFLESLVPVPGDARQVTLTREQFAAASPRIHARCAATVADELAPLVRVPSSAD